jgi:hypothetical protein
MVSLELVTDFIQAELFKKDVRKEKTGIIYIDDYSDRTTAMTEDIYSLCFITCIKPTELITLCPEVKEEATINDLIEFQEEEKKEGDLKTDEGQSSKDPARQYNCIPNMFYKNTIREFGLLTVFSVMFLTILLF